MSCFVLGNQSYKLCENTNIYWISFPSPRFIVDSNAS